jgi:RimJ/RimL family protein N-acetyltransferase
VRTVTLGRASPKGKKERREDVVKIEETVLEGRSVRLEPLAERHVPALTRAAADADLWKYMPFEIASEAAAAGWVAYAAHLLETQAGLVFANVERASGDLIGSTAFMAASPNDGRIEIGATWVVLAHQRSVANTEAKYLMLRHAFEVWDCNRVEFKTDALNEKSRKALARIGAVEEGTLRRHMRMPSGRMRDSVYFSVIQPDWPEVKRALEAKLAGR